MCLCFFLLRHFPFQNNLSSQVIHSSLLPGDLLTLGEVRVWGAGNVTMTNVTLTDADGKSHTLIPKINPDTLVSKCSHRTIYEISI